MGRHPTGRPTGRPPDAGQPRTRRVEFRVSESEIAEVEAARGEVSLSEWYRQAGLEKARRHAG